MKLALLGLALLTTFAEAAVERRSLDLRLPSQGLIEQQTISSPGASTRNSILNEAAGPTSAAAASTSSFAGQPDVPRNLKFTPGSTTSAVASCTITVSGTDIHNDSISEDFVFVNNQAGQTEGNKAFKTVTSVAWAANCEDGSFNETWHLGVGNKLGLKNCLDDAAHFLQAGYGGAYESTRPTLAVSASAVSSNTMLLNTTLAGSSVQALFIQNFACLP